MPRPSATSPTSLKDFFYLHQGVPVCDGLPWYASIPAPVVLPQAFGVDPHTTDLNDPACDPLSRRNRGPGIGDQTCSQKGRSRSLGLNPAGLIQSAELFKQMLGRAFRVPAAVRHSPASLDGLWTQTDEQKVLTLFGISGMVGRWLDFGEWGV